MNPYQVLGISPAATAEEIKQAYRREAMKWHPDRSGNSADARERFHQAAAAYRTLSDKPRSDNGDQARYSQSSATADGATGDDDVHDETGDPFADTVFWDVMLDYAIKLAQTGLSEQRIAIQLTQNGCPQRLASVIAEKGFYIHAHYAAGSEQKRKTKADKSSFKSERLEAELHRAFLGDANILWAPRGTIEYYLVIFAAFRQTANYNPLTWISPNKRLMRILNISLLVFIAIALVIHFYPGPMPLPDATMLQLPFLPPALMLVWTLYRKLWLFTWVVGVVYLATQAFIVDALPAALSAGPIALFVAAAVGFAPFIFVALFANYFYFRKAQHMNRAAGLLFDDQLDKVVWIKNRAGTSTMAAFIFLLTFVPALIYLAEFADGFSFSLPGFNFAEEDDAVNKKQRQLEQAGEYFAVAESYLKQSPPDYIGAEEAYNRAADKGSLLAAYTLGYLYYTGEGVRQNDLLAFGYFERATRAPLAFQPHSLKLTTEFLAESFNNLGIMYQVGLGTRRNPQKAKAMYRRAIEFGSQYAKRNLTDVTRASGRKKLVQPNYN